jgi:hypothetical protein
VGLDSPSYRPQTNRTGSGRNRIVFTSLFGLTELYWAVARNLPPEFADIFWITTNEFWTEFLTSNGIDRKRLLQLIYSPADFLGDNEKTKIIRQIVESEKCTGITTSAALMMDRFLAERPRKNVNDYVILYYRDMKRFLVENDITHVFAEPTNLNDLLLYMICRELGIPYISPRDMRYPPKRLVFFDGYLQDRILAVPGGDPHPSGRDILESFASRRPRPYYFEKLNRRRVVYPGKIAKSAYRRLRLRGVVTGHSLTHYDAWGRTKLTVRRAVNSFYMRRLCRYDGMDDIPGRIAFYGLHVQPENSIDVLGPFVSDQLKLIKDIRRSLPFDTTLIVKEHPNFLGMKSPGFFREVRKIPNVLLIRHDVPTFELYDRVDLVLTVSGTTAYEAGMLGIPAITFSPMYFGGLSSVRHCSSVTELKDLAVELLDHFSRDYDADCRFMETLLRNSHDGYWTDPLFDRSVLDPENIEKLTGAFSALLRSWSLSTQSA